MNILILGTSAAKSLPRENCRCSICRSRDEKDRRMRSSILINHKFLIDCGPDIRKQVKRFKIKVKDIKAVFLTHAHEDHTKGLKEIPFQNIPLYLSRTCQKILGKKLLSRFQTKIIKAGEKINPALFGQKCGVKIDNLIFQSIKVIHPWIETFAFKITSKSIRNSSLTQRYWVRDRNKFVIRSLVYMPDYKRVPKKSLKYFKNIDLLIVGGSSLERKLPWHATIRESIKLFKEMPVKKIYFTHIGHQTLPHKELVKFVKKEGGKNFDVCFDGQRIKV